MTIKQYYWANSEFENECWHDQGTRPWPNVQPGDYLGAHKLVWRDNPTPTSLQDNMSWPKPFVGPPTVYDADHMRNVQAFHEDIGAWCVQDWQFVRKHKLPWFHTPLYFSGTKLDRALREVHDLIVIVASHNWEEDFADKADDTRNRLERLEDLLKEMKNDRN
jgi:hypothetical protein